MTARRKEREKLEELYNSPKAELVTICGRIGIGKTYLVEDVFRNRIDFSHTALSPAATKCGRSRTREQLIQFYYSLLRYGMQKDHIPHDWMEAFFMLEMFLDGKKTEGKMVVFLDELPWLDTPRSGFITAFEGFWNNWGCRKDNLLLIVCGSANSWIINKLINNHGGLYNRVTYEINLAPFTLHECKEYFLSRNIEFSDYDITQAYMIMGGIPYYLAYITPEDSLARNIDNMFFSRNAKLQAEFSRLFSSVFDNPELIMEIVRILNKRSMGFERKDVLRELGRIDNSSFTRAFDALEAGNFVLRYVPFGKKKSQSYYKLIDPFCIFYLRFIENKTSLDEDFWMQNVTAPAINSWRGYAFENVCFNHIPQIKNALGISGVQTVCSQWFDNSSQIDLLIERKDNIVNMCEIKFYGVEFSVDKEYYKTLNERQVNLSGHLNKRTAVRNTLITTFGLKYNTYSGVFSRTITMEDLFKE